MSLAAQRLPNEQLAVPVPHPLLQLAPDLRQEVLISLVQNVCFCD